jgi:hypothetical protein
MQARHRHSAWPSLAPCRDLIGHEVRGARTIARVATDRLSAMPRGAPRPDRRCSHASTLGVGMDRTRHGTRPGRRWRALSSFSSWQQPGDATTDGMGTCASRSVLSRDRSRDVEHDDRSARATSMDMHSELLGLNGHAEGMGGRSTPSRENVQCTDLAYAACQAVACGVPMRGTISLESDAAIGRAQGNGSSMWVGNPSTMASPIVPPRATAPA